MYFDRKATCRYLRRRHKLYKAINNDLHGTSLTPVPLLENLECDLISTKEYKNAFKQIFQLFIYDNLDIFQVLETINLHKKIFHKYCEQFIENILLATGYQSGHKLAYIVYRVCKQNPHIFRNVVTILQEILNKQVSQQKCIGLQLSIFYTDLFLYGYYFTSKTFLEKIFFRCELFIIDYVIRLPPIAEWEVFLPRRYVFKTKTFTQNWVNQLIKKTRNQFQKLQAIADQIQQQIVQRKRNLYTPQLKQSTEQQKSICLDEQYKSLFDKYENTRQKLQYLQRDEGIKQARNIQQVKQQCDYYDPLFRLPGLLQKLYKERQIPKMTIKKIKKSQMINIFDDEAFLTQLRTCGSIDKAVDLSSYFIANLSSESNRQQLIEFIIDYCHHESNLDLIMKIITQINCQYPQLGDFMNKKAYKIACQIKMNKKYINLICQGSKYGLIDTMIILDYIEKRLITQHTQMNILETIRQSCNILQLLGQSIYHESLKINIFINKLFDLIEQKIKEKKLSIQFAFNLKCVKNYLRRPHLLPQILQNSTKIKQNQTLSQLTQQFTLKQHFDLILKRIKQLLTSKINNKTEQTYNKKRIVNYIISSVQNESNFIQTFYQASLVKQINHKQIKEEIVERCVQSIQSSIAPNIQQAIKWSRFLGQLYNYEILTRRKLTQILQGKLLYCAQLCSQQNFEKMVKCVIQCLNISKTYIIESQMSKQSNQYIINFLIKFKRSVLKYLSVKQYNKFRFDNLITEHQLEELLTYFHPILLQKLKSVDQIDLWTHKVKFSSSKDTLLSVNLYKVLQFYVNFDKVELFDPTLIDGFVKKPKILQRNQPVKSNKKVQYKQKNLSNFEPQIEIKVKTKQNIQEISKIKAIEKQIEQINENFRNEEPQSVPEQQKMIIKQESESLQKQLKQMMGITPQSEINEKFPQLNQRNLQTKKKDEQLKNQGMNNFKKILKNENGKKMKIIARKINLKETQ